MTKIPVIIAAAIRDQVRLLWSVLKNKIKKSEPNAASGFNDERALLLDIKIEILA
jgi:hypothetical protein